MNRSQETAFALAASAAIVTGHIAEAAPHQPEQAIEQQAALGATATHTLMHTETLTHELTQERPNAPAFSASPEATKPPTLTQQNQFESAVRRVTAGGHRLKGLGITAHTSDEAHNDPATRVTADINAHNAANQTLAETTGHAVAPVYEQIAESVTGYEVPTHVAKGSEVLRPELTAKVAELAREAKTTPNRLITNFNTHPEKLTEAARVALDVLHHDRNVQVELATTREVALPEPPTAVPAPRKREPVRTLQEGINQLPAQMGGPGYEDLAYGPGNKSATEAVSVISAQARTNQTSVTEHIKQPRPQNYSGASGTNMARNGRGRGGNKY